MKKLHILSQLSLLILLSGLSRTPLVYSQEAGTLAPSVPTLSLDFENGPRGIGRDGGEIVPRIDGKAEFQNGKFGQAFKSGPGTGYLNFPTQGLLSTQAGTVEMWVCPLDWNGDEKSFHMFFRAGGQGSLYLYKYYTSTLGLILLSQDGSQESNRLSYKNIDEWKAGEWHHIAATWSPALQTLYIDGVRVADGLPLLPKSLSEEFLIGDEPFNPAIPRSSQSLIDKVRVYDRVLSPEVIAAHYAGDYTKATPLTDHSARLDYDLEGQRFLTSLTLTGADVDTGQARADFAIMQGGRVAAQQLNCPFTGVTATADFTDDLAPGEYSIRTSVHDAKGKSQGTVSRPLTVPSREWMNNTLGEEKKVLAPWTPLTVKKDATGFTVGCWGRQYRFGNGLLPLQITAKGQPLLQSPMALKILSGGAPLQWTTPRAVLKDASDYEVNVTGTASALTPQGKLTVETNLHLEYDGLAVITLKMTAPPNFKPGAVWLDISVREAFALYHHGWAEDLKEFSGSLPAGVGVVQNSPFLPAAWLGDNERGLFWFCESAEHWPNWKDKNAFEVRHENNAMTMRLNLLNGQEMPEQWNFQFGLQATPVKPLAPDWRKWRLPPAPRPTAQILWPTTEPDSMKFFGYGEARDPEAFQKRVDAIHAEGQGVIPYSALNALSGATPEWKWFGKDWDVKAGDYGSGDVVAVGAPFHYTSPTQETWRDFVVWKNKQFAERHKLDGFYHDLTYPFGWAIPSANTGWFDGKEWQKTHPMLAYRELYRRNYTVVKAARPNSFLMGHMSARINIPVLAYEDAYLNGETFKTALTGKDSYMDVMSLDQWRTEYTGRQWGVIPFILPEFDSAHLQQKQPTRGLAALTLLHDTSVWGIWSNAAAWKEMYEALDAFGYVDSEFIPYFDAKPPAATDMKDVYISVYKRADGRALAVIGNTSREARNGTVTLDAERIGLEATQIVSWPDKKALTQKDGKIKIEIHGLDYRLVLIGKAP